MVREFLGSAHPQTGGAKPYQMNALLAEMRDLDLTRGAVRRGPNVAEIARSQRDEWADEFLGAAGPSSVAWAGEFLDAGPSSRYGSDAPALDAELAEWDDQWDDLTSHLDNPNKSSLPATAGRVAQKLNDPRFAHSEFLQFMNLVSQGELKLEEKSATDVDAARPTEAYGNSNWSDEFLAQHGNGLTHHPGSSSDWASEFLSEPATSAAPSQPAADQWVEEFSGGKASADIFRVADPPTQQDDFWSQLQSDWDKAAEENPSNMGWLKETSADATSAHDQYAFEADNPYQEQADPFNEALQKRQQGDLPSAILLFEAALQKNADHAQAWQMLGLSLSENEQDPAAITALKRCLALDPSNLVALMALAVSYTNESYQLQACKALEDWLKGNPKYAHLGSAAAGALAQPPSSSLNLVSSLVSADTFNHVLSLYLEAARLQPSADLDPDVQTGLGVLLNLSSDFDKAADCFRAALVVRPEDALLWNRLGATLANGGRSEEAVQAYYKALELSPGFIRARYNLAVSCINLGVHREACEHLVSTLHQQSRKRSRRVMSDNIWSTLRMVLNLMGRREFLADVDDRNLTRLSAEFGVAE